MARYELRPSAAPIWAQCAGSVRLSSLYPEDDTPAAREGTAAHWVASETVLGRQPRVGALTPNGCVVDEEMLEGADLYLDAVESRFPAAMAHVEDELPCPAIHEKNGGTVDLWGLGTVEPARAILHVMDYKYGHGFVSEFENWQLLTYVSGVVSKLTAEGVLDPRVSEDLLVEMTVVQPRNYHKDGPVRPWRVTLRDLRAQFNYLRSQAAEALGPNPRTVVGGHCDYCPARHGCQALQRAAMTACDVAGTAVPFDLGPHETGVELRRIRYAIKLLEARESGLAADALRKIQAGLPVAHFAAEPSEGRERCIPGKEADLIMAAALLGHDITKPPAPLPPGKLKKLPIDAAVISQYLERPRGETKLVAVDTNKTRKIFGA